MIPPQKRLPISVFSKKGAPLKRSPYFSVHLSKNNLPHNRFNAIIGKRLLPLAVKRHRFKRQILQVANTWPEKGYDILILPQKGYIELHQKDRLQKLKELQKELLS